MVLAHLPPLFEPYIILVVFEGPNGQSHHVCFLQEDTSLCFGSPYSSGRMGLMFAYGVLEALRGLSLGPPPTLVSFPYSTTYGKFGFGPLIGT